MHILISVLHRPTQPTGVCRHAASLAQCLSALEAVTQVTVLIGSWQQLYFTSVFGLTSSKIKIVPVEIKNTSLSRNRWFVFGLPKVANQLGADLTHLSFPIPVVRRWFKAPVVATIHDLYPFECPGNFGYPQVWFNQWFLKQCIQQSDRLTCVSEVTRQALVHYFPTTARDRSFPTVVYNSVTFAEVTPQKPQQGNLSDLYLLCVAQHRKNKNLDLLIRAYAHLRETGQLPPHSQLVLVGSAGPETNALKELVAQHQLADNVLMLSGLEDSELQWLYKHCEVFAIASSSEGFCIPLVEAQALGSKVVCSDIPIFQEVGSSRCHYFSLRDRPINNLSEAINAAVNKKAKPVPFIDPKFLKPGIASQYADLYRETIAAAR